MPYNTRRKSLSLPALGIQLPQSSRAHRPTLSRSSDDADSRQAHPSKRVKRSHNANPPSSPTAASPPLSSAASITKSVTFADRPKSRHAYEHTPPPSPGATDGCKIDTEGINDDIVVGVIEQLEMTGNRPHLIKELATVLSTTNASAANSANPTALLSSRLATYMRRPWSAIAPCPIAKELIPVHPRKVFYYLTTTPRQELPVSPVDGVPPGARSLHHPASHKRIISPSLSNPSQDDDDPAMAEDRKRAALSPSPEIDLSIDDLEDPGQPQRHFSTPGSSLSSCRASLSGDDADADRDYRHHRRTESPPLEGDEREFSDTARDMRLRGGSGSVEESAEVALRLAAAKLDPPTAPASASAAEQPAESEEEHVKRNSEAAATLFGASDDAAQGDGAMMLSSPMMKPAHHVAIKAEGPTPVSIYSVIDDSVLGEAGINYGLGLGFEILRPESMELDELDGWFEDY